MSAEQMPILLAKSFPADVSLTRVMFRIDMASALPEDDSRETTLIIFFIFFSEFFYGIAC